MEESMSLLLGIRDVFGCKNVDIRTYSPLTLAFVGDCIYDLVIRTVVVERGNTAPNTLHQKKERRRKSAGTGGAGGGGLRGADGGGTGGL